MTEPVKAAGQIGPRGYDSTLRAERAASTRRAILDAARACFADRGYALTTIAEISRQAGVAVDTVYASVGKKPALLRELVETSLSGGDHAVPAQQRDYVRRVMAAPTAREKLAIYAGAVVTIQQRLAPVFLALSEAAGADADCRELWTEISERRAANMVQFAADLRRTGELRSDLDDQQVADIIWSMNGTEYWVLLAQRGWRPADVELWLVDAWTRLLLAARPAEREVGSEVV